MFIKKPPLNEQRFCFYFLFSLNLLSGVPSFFTGTFGFASLFSLKRLSGVPSFFTGAFASFGGGGGGGIFFDLSWALTPKVNPSNAMVANSNFLMVYTFLV